ncbi:MAG: Lrp/AsnC ligand binding domain-containing protein [Terriglobia bacterium]
MKAYVLINVRAGKARDVVKKVQGISEAKGVHPCWGRPDIFTFVEVKDEKTLAETVLARIQAIDGVESTDTHIVIE